MQDVVQCRETFTTGEEESARTDRQILADKLFVALQTSTSVNPEQVELRKIVCAWLLADTAGTLQPNVWTIHGEILG